MSRSKPLAKRKPPVRGGIRVKAYDVLQRAVEDGLNYGWRRAHKHTDTPHEEATKDALFNGVMDEIASYFDFDEAP